MPAYKDKDGRWRYRFSHRGRPYSGSTPAASNTKVTAERLEKQHAERVTGGITSTTLVPFAERYNEHQRTHTKPLSHRNEKSRIKAIVAALGNIRLEDIGKEHGDRLASTWKTAGLAPGTINLRLATLTHLLQTAREWKLVATVPTFEPLDVEPDDPRFLTRGEADHLIAAAADHWRPMMLVGLRTGLRIGELRGLDWSDIDWRLGRIWVRRTHPGRAGMEATSPKSKKYRRVPMSPDTVRVLRELDVRKTGLVFPAPRRGKKATGRPWSERGCHCAILKAAERAGLKDIGWHTLRHTFASWLVMSGVPLKLVQEWLGHGSMKMTERYAHLAPGFGDTAIDVLDGYRSHDHGKLLTEGSDSRKDNEPLPT